MCSFLGQHPAQPVPHAPHVLDQRRLGARFAQLAPQARCVRVERSGTAGDPIVPDVAQELAFREHPLGLAGEADEQLVFLLGELNAPAVDADVARSRVDPDRRRFDDVVERRA